MSISMRLTTSIRALATTHLADARPLILVRLTDKSARHPQTNAFLYFPSARGVHLKEEKRGRVGT